MRKFFVTLCALAVTAALVWSLFGFQPRAVEPPSLQLSLIRVWVSGQDPAVWSWLRKAAKQYENETGRRVYLRAGPAEDAGALSGEYPPDLLISHEKGKCVALHGFALFCRDESAQAVTPDPTSFLFFRPSPTPGVSPTPVPTPNTALFSVLIVPQRLSSSFPGSLSSANPLRDFIDGKGDAAVLSVGQAAQLPFQTVARPLPAGKGFLPIRSAAATPKGEDFFNFLLMEQTQRMMTESGLFSPSFSLYQGIDPLREMIESTIPSFNPQLPG